MAPFSSCNKDGQGDWAWSWAFFSRHLIESKSLAWTALFRLKDWSQEALVLVLIGLTLKNGTFGAKIDDF
jgi:hypothetical protein